MNERSTYELTIAGKLKELPLPDMMDAIWARVEKQLDIDLPTDDGGGSSGTTGSPTGGWTFGSIAGIILAAFALIFLVNKKYQPIPSPTPAEKNIMQESSVEKVPELPDRERGNLPLPVMRDIGVQDKPEQTQIGPATPVDSLMVNGKVLIDTNRLSPPLALLPVPDTVPKQLKKGKGVSGLTDADYRIVPSKKDSI